MRSRNGSRMSPPSMMGVTVMPSNVWQSSSVTMTSCATSTRRRVRYPESAVLSAVSARPLRAVGGDEVLQHREAFAEVRGDRRLDDFARGLGHQTAHAGELANLLFGTAGAGVGHHEDRVELGAVDLGAAHLAEHLVGDVLGGAVPDVDDLVVALAVGDRAVETLALDFEHRLARAVDDLGLLRRDDHVIDADGDAGLGRVEEAEVLELVEQADREVVAEVDEPEVHQLLQTLLLEEAVDERDLLRHVHVEDHAADGGLDDLSVELLDLGVRDILVVEVLGQVEEAAAEAQA